LAQAVRDLAESAATRGGFILDLKIAEPLDGLTPEAEQALYRIAQEALENVVLHAGASMVRVALSRQGERIVLSVADDGRGLSPQGVEDSRLGLRGMQERARLIGGELRVQNRAEGGTEVRIEMEAKT
jgi:signal transduction histidine kinase